MTDFSIETTSTLRYDRVLYFIGLPAIIFNYAASAVISLVLGAATGASQVSLLVDVLFLFPISITALVCVVWAQFTAHIKTFNTQVRAALTAVIIDILLIGLFFVPSNSGTALKPVAQPNSVLTHLLGFSTSASAGIANVLMIALPAIMVYLIVVAIMRARENQAEMDDSFNLH